MAGVDCNSANAIVIASNVGLSAVRVTVICCMNVGALDPYCSLVFGFGFYSGSCYGCENLTCAVS